MSEIKEKLEKKINETMLPEINTYIEELNALVKSNEDSEDDLMALDEMFSLKEELNSILKAIEEDKITDKEADEVYENILALIEESDKH